MEKLTIIIIIAVGLILLAVLVTVLIITNQKVVTTNKESNKVSLINLYLKSSDLFSGKQLSANYIISSENLTYKTGTTTDSDWTELAIPINQRLQIYCWNDDYYVSRNYKSFSELEISNNKSSYICSMNKIGDLTITSDGLLQNIENTITLHISTQDWFYHVSICEAHSTGIMSVNPLNQAAICNSGNWLNWTSYNATTNKYNFLSNNQYRCGEENDPNYMLMTCSSVNGNFCFQEGIPIPRRYSNLVDSCFSFPKNIHNETYDVNLDIKMDNPNTLDQVTFYIFDNDLSFDPNSNQWKWISESDKQIGGPDYPYTIYYSR